MPTLEIILRDDAGQVIDGRSVKEGRNQSSAPPAQATKQRGADWGLMGMLA